MAFGNNNWQIRHEEVSFPKNTITAVKGKSLSKKNLGKDQLAFFYEIIDFFSIEL